MKEYISPDVDLFAYDRTAILGPSYELEENNVEIITHEKQTTEVNPGDIFNGMF